MDPKSVAASGSGAWVSEIAKCKFDYVYDSSLSASAQQVNAWLAKVASASGAHASGAAGAGAGGAVRV